MAVAVTGSLTKGSSMAVICDGIVSAPMYPALGCTATTTHPQAVRAESSAWRAKPATRAGSGTPRG